MKEKGRMVLMKEEEEEGAADWRGRAIGRIRDKIAFLGNEDGHHGNCSWESHDTEEWERERGR